MKTFRTAGACVPEKNYMVNLSSRLAQIKTMVDRGDYFTINRARQFGKTTMLTALSHYLCAEYTVLSLDFQGISTAGFATEEAFVKSFCRLIRRERQSGLLVPVEVEGKMDGLAGTACSLDDLFDVLYAWCAEARIVLMIDEVDSATNFQVFRDFLAHLREGYIRRDTRGARTFQSVILAGVTVIKNLRQKLRPDEAHKYNSPWNIAADFNVDMSFSAQDIAGMLEEYEADHRTGMDISMIAQAIEDYTSGYPFLVSRICQLLDADGQLSWNLYDVGEVVRRILMEKNTLFDSLMGKVHDNKRLREILWKVLIAGESVAYNAYDAGMADAEMYGFVRNDNGMLQISNRIFETLLYNFFLSEAELSAPAWQVGVEDKLRFIRDGRLDMDLVLERYVEIYDDLYGDQQETFAEYQGTLRFLLFVRPIINGTGNYYIEAQTRDKQRMDLVIDYRGERFVVELKLWRGPRYHSEGEQQLCGYLDRLHLDKGYLLTYSFNREKTVGIRRVCVNGKVLVEAMV